MELNNTIYKVKTTVGGFFFSPEIHNGCRGILQEEALYQLKKFCARKEAQGHIISSVSELCAYNESTPRVAFRDKEYRSMVEEIRRTGSVESLFTTGKYFVFFFRFIAPDVKKNPERISDLIMLNFRVCNIIEQFKDFSGPDEWADAIKHGGLYGVCFEGEKIDYIVYGDELKPLEECHELIPGFYREVGA